MEELLRQKWDDIINQYVKVYDIGKLTYEVFMQTIQIHSLDEETNTIILTNNDKVVVDRFKAKYQESLNTFINVALDGEFEIKMFLTDELNVAKPIPSLIKDNNKNVNLNPTLNNKYTFDTFVIGKKNEFAYAASLAVAEDPANAYNPFFIYGGVGLGKTHLMHSIGHYISEQNKESSILYVSSEKFTNELIDAIKCNKTEAFRQKYRSIDVLMVDDIQFLAGKESVQEEFFHTFNTLYDSKKQIIISSDRPPEEIETLEERLRTRFKMGLTADIKAPDYETRIAILKKKTELDNSEIDEEIIKYIASNIKSNIRELEGALTRILAHSKLLNKEPTLEQSIEVIKDLISPNENREITPEYIIETVCSHYSLSTDDIKSKKRNREVVYPRQIIMYLCRKYTDTSLQTVGNLLGGRDHTTIMHGLEKVDVDYNTNSSIKKEIDIILKKLSLQ